MSGGEGSTFDRYQSFRSRIFLTSLLLEFFGCLCFQFLGGTVEDKTLGPFVNGFALAVLVYISANVSGGHLNPAVTFSTFVCGFYPLLHSLLYIVVQILGCMTGAALSAVLLVGTTLDGGRRTPGCFDQQNVPALKYLSKAQVFGWEAIMTFVLISAVYACGVAKPGHGSFTPLVVGLSLVACAGTGASRTGAALNPARVLGPATVFDCGWSFSWVYILAQLSASVAACLLFGTVSGWGPLFPAESQKLLGLSKQQSIRLWVTGTPPANLRAHEGDTVEDVLHHLEEEAEAEAHHTEYLQEPQDAKLLEELQQTQDKSLRFRAATKLALSHSRRKAQQQDGSAPLDATTESARDDGPVKDIEN